MKKLVKIINSLPSRVLKKEALLNIIMLFKDTQGIKEIELPYKQILTKET